MKTGIITSNRFKQHLTGKGHPESPERLDAILSELHDCGILDSHPVEVPNLIDLTLPDLVHTHDYLSMVKESCKRGDEFIISHDNPISAESYEIAVLATNAVAHGISKVMNEEWINGMALVRPPGHHAERTMPMGFCLMNNVAIGAKYLQKEFNVEKIAIIDFDVHHGNGTQHIFESDSTVFFTSIHQSPFYPGTGKESETGIGEGNGFTKNYPLPKGQGDKEYYDIIDNDLADRVLGFDPDFIILSAGFDAHHMDPIGEMNITTEGYYQISKKLVQISNECCGGKLVSVLEGGYHLDALAESVKVHINALSERKL